MCKILAVRLGNKEFKQWVDNELNGYASGNDLPRYRVLHTESYGDFSGPFGSGLRNVPIPPSCLPKELRDLVTTSYLTGPISSYASLIHTEDRDNAQESWPADMVAYYGNKIYRDMNCLAAWKVISYNALTALVDTIRTRVLNFALEIEGEAPDAGEASRNFPPLPQEKVSRVFNTYISGNVQNVATGSSNVSQNGSFMVTTGDFGSLGTYLSSLGVNPNDISDLDAAIQKDKGAHGKASVGVRVQEWIGKMIGKAASGSWSVSTSVAGTVLGKALSKYFGLE